MLKLMLIKTKFITLYLVRQINIFINIRSVYFISNIRISMHKEYASM